MIHNLCMRRSFLLQLFVILYFSICSLLKLFNQTDGRNKLASFMELKCKIFLLVTITSIVLKSQLYFANAVLIIQNISLNMCYQVGKIQSTLISCFIYFVGIPGILWVFFYINFYFGSFSFNFNPNHLKVLSLSFFNQIIW